MLFRNYSLFILLILSTTSFISCSNESADDLLVFSNAIIWDGMSDSFSESSAIVTKNGSIVRIIDMNEPDFPNGSEIIDLNNNYVIPGLINAHGHVGIAKGLNSGPEAHSTSNVVNQLKLYAAYGITTVVSLGDEPIHAFLVRDGQMFEQVPMSRLYLAGDVLHASTVEEVSDEITNLLTLNPDWSKVRVDDGLGTRDKMSSDIYTAFINESHKHNLPIAIHIVTLEDAKGVIQSGADLIAHSIRDLPVDEELIDLMLEQEVCITPTLTREVSAYIYAERPDFFDDPFFLSHVDTFVVNQLQHPDIQEYFRSESADFYKNALPLAMENMLTLYNSGVKIAMGTDSGPPARFQGYFEHMEMEMMQSAGIDPLGILLSATRTAARCMGIDNELGTLEPGKKADFVVLSDNPLEDITNLRSIVSVYIGANKLP